MWTRTAVILFLGMLIFGVWFQRNYMEIYSSEFEMEAFADRSKTEVARMTNFLFIHTDGRTELSRFQASDGRLQNNGEIWLKGPIHIISSNYRGNPGYEIKSQLAFAKLSHTEKNQPLLNTERQINHLFFPNKVTIHSENDTIMAKTLRIDKVKNTAETNETVELMGPGRTLTGRGLTYHLESGEFNLKGPVQGVWKRN